MNGTLSLPVVSRPVLTAILSNLPVPALLDDAAGQVILRFERDDGSPVDGLRLGTPITTGIVAFDSGPGIYTTATQATSTGGTILVLNTGGGGQLPLTVIDTSAGVDGGYASYTLLLPLAAGAATFALITLPTP